MSGRKLEMSTRSGSNYDTSGEESSLVSDCSGGFETRLYVHSSFAIILMGKRESWLLCLVCPPGVRDGCVALPRGAIGLSSVCDSVYPLDRSPFNSLRNGSRALYTRGTNLFTLCTSSKGGTLPNSEGRD